MLALAHVSVLSLVVHASLIAVFLLVFPVAAGRLAGNTSHIYPSSLLKRARKICREALKPQDKSVVPSQDRIVVQSSQYENHSAWENLKSPKKFDPNRWTQLKN
ncbi:hypothetical protein C8R46DRAFT_1027613 [Mycena filopes]|nr:hypothetical protein C8R46DRAFT_1027613 [Mycena filopes]